MFKSFLSYLLLISICYLITQKSNVYVANLTLITVSTYCSHLIMGKSSKIMSETQRDNVYNYWKKISETQQDNVYNYWKKMSESH